MDSQNYIRLLMKDYRQSFSNSFRGSERKMEGEGKREGRGGKGKGEKEKGRVREKGRKRGG